MSFLEEERDAWRPYEALDSLSDEALAQPVEAARGWSGRDLMAHLVAWQDVALRVAKELANGETSPSKVAADADWEARGGEIVNAELLTRWAAVPLDELRRHFSDVPGELRGYLTVVPEARWVKDADVMAFLASETLDHYEEHRDDLAAVLAAAR